MDDFLYAPLMNIISIFARELAKRKLFRKRLFIITGIFEVISITLAFVSYYLLDNEIIFNISIGFIVLLSFCISIILYSFQPDILLKKSVHEKLNELENEKNEIERKIENEKSGNVQDIIRLNLNQLDGYYTINKSQSKKAYALSMLMILVGFVLIVVAIFLYLFNTEKYTLSLITGLLAIVSEFIGATSLILYRESTKHVNEFLQQLSYLQKVMLAIDLTERLPAEKKNETLTKIITGIINTNVTTSDKTTQTK